MLKLIELDFRFKVINCLYTDLGSKTGSSVRCDAHPIHDQLQGIPIPEAIEQAKQSQM